jgi:hypothetical protein
MRLAKFVLFSVFAAGCSGKVQTFGGPDGTGTGTSGTGGTAGDRGSGGGSSGRGGTGASSGRGGTDGTNGTTAADAAIPPLDAGNPPGVRPPRPDPLCDGSTAVRLLIYSTGGRGTFPAFAVPFGTAFAFVDGQCRFFAGTTYTLGYRSGVLTAEQAADVARETFWVQLPALDGLETEQCPDSRHLVVTDGQHVARSRCPRGDGPALGTLASVGTLLEGPVLVATALQQPPAGFATHAWPMAASPAVFAADGEDPWSTAGIRVTDAADVARLRQVRSEVVLGRLGENNPFYVTMDEGGRPTYAVYVRDDVPENMRRAVEDIWARQPR